VSDRQIPARLLDPSGAPWVRYLFFFGAIALALFGMALRQHADIISWMMALSLALGFIPIRFRPRAVSLIVSRGAVAIRNSNVLNRTIRPRDVIGCTTANVENEHRLILSLKHRREPTTLSFATEDDLNHTREALAVGHGGFGRISAPLVWGGIGPLFGVAYFCALVAVGLAVAAGRRFSMEQTILLAYASPGLIPYILWRRPKPPFNVFTMASDGVFFATRGVGNFIPYSSIEEVAFDAHSLMLDLTLAIDAPFVLLGRETKATPLTRHRRVSLRAVAPGVRRSLVAALADAMARARGAVKPKPPIAFPISSLRIGSDEAISSWVARLDALAASATTGGYRAGHVDPEDLWHIYEDPDFPPDIRAAAARVLSRAAKDSSLRIEEGTATFHEAKDIKRVRIALQETFTEEDEAELATLARYSLPPPLRR